MPPAIVQEDGGAHGSLWNASLSGLGTPVQDHQTKPAERRKSQCVVLIGEGVAKPAYLDAASRQKRKEKCRA